MNDDCFEEDNNPFDKDDALDCIFMKKQRKEPVRVKKLLDFNIYDPKRFCVDLIR